MSTVLEALRRQQQGTAGITERAPFPMEHTWRPLWWLAAAGGVAFTAVLTMVIWRADTRRTDVKSAPVSVPRTQAAPANLPAPPSGSHSMAIEEPPRGRVTDSPLAASKPAAAPKPKRAVQAEPAAAARPDAAAAVPRSHTADPQPLPGSGNVLLKSIHYASESARRTVTVLIGTETATLHEGETVGGVEVQLILPDMVYIRNGGSVSAIGGPR